MHGPKCWWKKGKKREEGGVTGLILQPLDDDLRTGRGIEPDPAPATKKWKNKNQQTLTQLNENPHGSVQPNATTVRYP